MLYADVPRCFELNECPLACTYVMTLNAPLSTPGHQVTFSLCQIIRGIMECREFYSFWYRNLESC
jgi:hypothetical protein